MPQPKLTSTDREFLATLAEVIFGNPFTSKRDALIVRLAPGAPLGDLVSDREALARVVAPKLEPLLRELRRRGIKVGVLSNTMWPRHAHEQIFVRDEVLELIDGAVYTSEIDWVKPHQEAFRAVMAAIGETDPAACVFVGDRPYDDIHGAKSAGMRAVLITNSDVPRYEAAEPDATISRLSELLDHLDSWS